jgi:ankyrin repeat protein
MKMGNEGKASLHAAAEEGNIDTVKSLLERGVDINAAMQDNQTPLDRAAAKGKVDVVRLLVERGAEVDSRDSGVGHRCTRHHDSDTSKSRRCLSITVQT